VAQSAENLMSERQILLPDRVYDRLLAVAQAQGVSPTEWIASNLPDHDSIPPPNLFKDVSDLIGSIDSRMEPHQTYQKTAFGEALALKLAKQGIQRQ
jgi:hypothetical protein